MKHIGRYEVVSELGRGGVGVVYKAWDPEAHEHVAIKLLHDASNARSNARFQREAEALQRLRHPHVVPVREYGHVEGKPYLVMSYVDGQALDAVVEAHGLLSAKRAADMGLKLAEALAAGHALGILHRDVKPSNVLLTDDGRVVLGDFGLAKDVGLHATQLTVEGGFMGTVGFVAPEQAQGLTAELGPSADVYGLGATLYYALGGRAPVVGETLIQALENMKRPPPPLRELRAYLSADLAAIVDRCVQPELTQRYRSCALVAEDLGRVVEANATTPLDVPGPLDAAVRRVRALLVGVGALGLLAALAIVAGPSNPAVEPEQAVVPPASQTPASPGPRPAAEPEAGPEPEVESEPQRAPSLPPPVGYVEPAPSLDSVESGLAAAAEALVAGDRDAARRAFELVLLRDPEQAEALHGLFPLLAEEDPRRVQVLEHAYALDPRPAAAQQLAELRVGAGQHEAGLSLLRRALQAHPDSGLLSKALGELLNRLGRYDEALPHLERGLQLTPDLATTINLASCLSALRRWTEALPLARAAAQNAPGYPAAHHLLGSVLLAMGDGSGALASFEHAHAVGPDYDAVHLPLAKAYRRAGELERAQQFLDSQLQQRPDNVGLLFERAQLHSAQGNGTAELLDLSTVLELMPNNKAALHNRSLVLFGAGRFEESRADSQRLVQLDAQDGNAWTQLGASHFALEDWALASEAYGRAIELDAENHMLWVGRGQALYMLKSYPQAIADFEHALARDPKQHEARWHMGHAEYLRGDSRAALAVMQELREQTPPGHNARETADYWIKRIKQELASGE